MSHRVISISGRCYVRLKDNQLVVARDNVDTGHVPIEDLAVVVLDGPEVALSHQLLSFCADQGVAVITSDQKHMPNGLHLPLANNSTHSATLRLQIQASVPNQKRTWQSIVKAKIRSQADVLFEVGLDGTTLQKLVPMVRSGDPDNVEATAASRYFPLMFGVDFIRDRDQAGINACLNYGYAIIRSSVARAIVGSGMHPALGVFHKNKYNPFCLADDAMEPLRTLADYRVWQLAKQGQLPEELDPQTKRHMIEVLGHQIRIDDLTYPLLVGLERYAASLRRSICDSEPLSVPLPLYSSHS